MLDALSTRLALAGNQSNSPSHGVKDTTSKRRYSGTYDRYNSGERGDKMQVQQHKQASVFPPTLNAGVRTHARHCVSSWTPVQQGEQKPRRKNESGSRCVRLSSFAWNPTPPIIPPATPRPSLSQPPPRKEKNTLSSIHTGCNHTKPPPHDQKSTNSTKGLNKKNEQRYRSLLR